MCHRRGLPLLLGHELLPHGELLLLKGLAQHAANKKENNNSNNNNNNSNSNSNTHKNNTNNTIANTNNILCYKSPGAAREKLVVV